MSKYRSKIANYYWKADGGLLASLAGPLGALAGPLGALAGPAMGLLADALNKDKIEPEIFEYPTPKAMAEGGMLNTVDVGGRHESNPIGGVPIGNNQSVEQGETIANQFVYSDRLTIDDDLIKEYFLPKSVKGKTFAEASKLLASNKTDNISKRGDKKMLDRLAEAQESYKSAIGMSEITEQMAGGGPLGLKMLKNLVNPLPITNMELPIEEGVSDKWSDPPAFGPQQTPPMYGLPTAVGNKTQLPITNMDLPTEEGVSDKWSDSKQGDDINYEQAKFSPLRYAPVLGDLLAQNFINSNAQGDIPLDKFNTNTQFQERLINRDQIKRDLTSQERGLQTSLQDASGGNSASFLANSVGSGLNTRKAMANADLQAQMADVQEKARVEQLNYQQQANNKQSERQVQDLNDRNKGAVSSAQVDSMSNMFNNVGKIGSEETNKQIVNQMFGYDIHGRYKKAVDDGMYKGDFISYVKSMVGMSDKKGG